MHAGITKPLGITLAAAGLLVFGAGGSMALGDEPGLFGRLFRLGGGAPAPPRSTRPAPRDAAPEYRSPPPGMSQAAPTAPTPALLPPGGGTGPSTPAAEDVGAPAPTQVIRPQPRVTRAATEADPVLTRVALGRADDGNQFGMFLQVYADGTVIDGEGVHRLGPEAIRPLMALLQAGELAHVSGHCGGPPTDFIEQMYVVVYERRLGSLRASSFSYSGNTAGCSPSVRQLHQVLEQLSTRLSSPGAPATAAPATAAAPTVLPTAPTAAADTFSPAPAAGLGAATGDGPAATPLPPVSGGSTLSLTPAGE